MDRGQPAACRVRCGGLGRQRRSSASTAVRDLRAPGRRPASCCEGDCMVESRGARAGKLVVLARGGIEGGVRGSPRSLRVLVELRRRRRRHFLARDGPEHDLDLGRGRQATSRTTSASGARGRGAHSAILERKAAVPEDLGGARFLAEARRRRRRARGGRPQVAHPRRARPGPPCTPTGAQHGQSGRSAGIGAPWLLLPARKRAGR